MTFGNTEQMLSAEVGTMRMKTEQEFQAEMDRLSIESAEQERAKLRGPKMRAELPPPVLEFQEQLDGALRREGIPLKGVRMAIRHYAVQITIELADGRKLESPAPDRWERDSLSAARVIALALLDSLASE